jgi:hypothetical protein
MKKKIIFLTIVFAIISISTIAQTEKSINEKLKDVKDAQKIVITTEKGNIIFDGTEAQELLDKMKSQNLNKKIRIISEGDSILTEDFEGIDTDEDAFVWKTKDGCKKIIKHHGKGNKMMLFMDDDDMKMLDGKKIIKLNVEDENGEKTVTATTIENGEKKVETYKGKEADEFLNKMDQEHNIKVDLDVETDSIGQKSKKIWIHNSVEGDNVNKKVQVEIEDGVKKVTVTTNENGKEKVENYEGDEAEKYLKKNQNYDHNGKKIKKKIILK